MAETTAPMRFRPCIDLHDGKVKQIVGASLKDLKDAAPSTSSSSSSSSSSGDGGGGGGDSKPVENFVSAEPAAHYAELYKRDALPGGHVIMLGGGNEEAALSALRAYPGGMQVGGGIKPETAPRYIEAGASHVIVTSYVFKDGKVSFENLRKMVDSVGKDRLVLDLSCRKRPKKKSKDEGAASAAGGGGGGGEVAAAAAATDLKDEASDDLYYVVTDRWQKYTDVAVTRESLATLAEHCDEFLVHGVEVEGMRQGVLEDLVQLLADHSPIPVTYAGGVRDMGDVERVREVGGGRVHLTIGSALDVFGGAIPYQDVVRWQRQQEAAAKREGGHSERAASQPGQSGQAEKRGKVSDE